MEMEMAVALGIIVAAIAGGALGYRLCLERNKGMAIPWFIDD
jgi:hypothetical protein